MHNSDRTITIQTTLMDSLADFRVLYVRLGKLTRTAQRYAVSSIIRERWARKGEFIVIFYTLESDVWHLVSPYVTEGRTILRRYVVRMGEKHRTVSENLANMVAAIAEPLFDRVQDAFKLKPVTERFYEDYKHYFNKIKDYIRSLGIDIRDSKGYSHLFLNRLMFVYFIQKKGIEFLRNMYAASGLSIRPKTQLTKIEILKEMIRSMGGTPEETLLRKMFVEPHRVYANQYERQEDYVKELRNSLKQMVRKELLDARNIE